MFLTVLNVESYVFECKYKMVNPVNYDIEMN